MKDQDCEKETGPEREPFYISLGQRFKSFQVAPVIILERLPAAICTVFIDGEEEAQPDEETPRGEGRRRVTDNVILAVGLGNQKKQDEK